MTRQGLACVLLLALLLPACGGSRREPGATVRGPRLTAQIARTLDARLRQKVAETGIPGASAAIVFPDGREWSGAAGAAVLKPRRPMTVRTSLPFDSVTKVATAALAMRLVEQGRLRLDDPIRRWYHLWRGDPRASVRDLLGHTSGARDPEEAFFQGLLRHPRTRWTPRQAIAVSPPPGPRTSEAVYSNTGFVIAGLILARAAGEPVAAAMRDELFGHPGGDGLAFQPAERTHVPRAHSYVYPHGVGDPVDANDGGQILPFPAVADAAGTAGALAGDVPSLARWGRELFAGHIIQPSSLHEMTRFHAGAFWEAYGLGLARDTVDGHAVWGHGGDGFGSHTEFWYLPREHLTVAMTWNDDLIDQEGNVLPTLLRAALRSG
jgi:D-alanyl-D-alanine carboxypeptidase